MNDIARRPAGLRIGIDVVDPSEVAASIERFGGRYLDRVFTAAEQAGCRSTSDGVTAERLAARFAAKEAVRKALSDDAAMPWTDIEVLRTGAAPSLRLAGVARRVADAQGLDRWAVSLTHERSMAAAVAVATSTTGEEVAGG